MVLRVISIMLFLMALEMLVARIFAGLDISTAFIIGPITVAIALMTVAQGNAKRSNSPD